MEHYRPMQDYMRSLELNKPKRDHHGEEKSETRNIINGNAAKALHCTKIPKTVVFEDHQKRIF